MISDIYQTECDPETGIGLLGFVITYLDAHVENRVLGYTKANYHFCRLSSTSTYQVKKTAHAQIAHILPKTPYRGAAYQAAPLSFDASCRT